MGEHHTQKKRVHRHRNRPTIHTGQSTRPRTHTPSTTKKNDAGSDLLSHTLPGAVPSAQAGLASGFGKGPGVTPPLKPPTNTTKQHTPHTPHNTPGGPGTRCRSRHCTVDAKTLTTTQHTHTIRSEALGQLVPVTSSAHTLSRSGLSTPSSTGNLTRNLISKQASRLDAFSGYPSHT